MDESAREFKVQDPSLSILTVRRALLAIALLLCSVETRPQDNVQIIGRALSGTDCYNIFVQDTLAYVTAGDKGLRILDIANPTSPVLKGQYSGNGMVKDVLVVGNLAYLARQDNSYKNYISVLDVTNPVIPRPISELYVHASFTNIFCSGGFVYASASHYPMQIMDFRDYLNPKWTAEYGWGSSYGIFVSADWAYLGFESGDVSILDVSDPTKPTFYGSFSCPGTGVHPRAAFAIVVRNGLAYVAAGTSGLHIADVSNPTWPVPVATLDTPGVASDLFLAGSLAYVADGSGGLQVLDVANSRSPRIVGTIALDGDARGVYEQNGLVYVSASTGVWVIRYTPAPPDLIAYTSGTLPRSARRGSVVSTKFVVQNVGDSDAGATWCHIYLSTDQNHDPTDFLWRAGILVPALSPEISFVFEDDLHVPDLPQGTYHILVECDVTNSIAEISENNIFSLGSFQIYGEANIRSWSRYR